MDTVLFRTYKKYRSVGLLRLIGWFSSAIFGIDAKLWLDIGDIFFRKISFNIFFEDWKMSRLNFKNPEHFFLISETSKC